MNNRQKEKEKQTRLDKETIRAAKRYAAAYKMTQGEMICFLNKKAEEKEKEPMKQVIKREKGIIFFSDELIKNI